MNSSFKEQLGDLRDKVCALDRSLADTQKDAHHCQRINAQIYDTLDALIKEQGV